MNTQRKPLRKHVYNPPANIVAPYKHVAEARKASEEENTYRPGSVFVRDTGRIVGGFMESGMGRGLTWLVSALTTLFFVNIFINSLFGLDLSFTDALLVYPLGMLVANHFASKGGK